MPLLTEHFLNEIAKRNGRRPRTIDAAALGILAELPFLGNVRQLRNLIEAAHVFAEGEITGPDVERILENGPAMSAPERESAVPATDDPYQAPTFEEFKNQSEALFFRLRLEANGGNVKHTAEELGMHRSHLYKKLDRYGLK